MSKSGWFLIHRSLFSHWLWNDKPFSRGQAWIDLLGLANHSDVDTTIRGKVITGERGDVNRSLRFLADRWGWSVGKVKRFLDVLETEQMVTQKRNKNETVITIENYSKYQPSADRDELQRNTKWNTNGTRNETQTEHRRNTNNKLEIIKNNYYRYSDNDNDELKLGDIVADEE